MPFTPFYGQTVSISASTSSANTTVSNTSANQLVITNSGTALVFVNVGSATATTSDLPILPGAAIVISRQQEDVTVSAITASGTTTVYITPGYGE